MFELSIKDCISGKTNWISNVKELLTINGYGYIWDNPQSVCLTAFRKTFKQCLLDIFTQTWKADLEANQVLDIYKVKR